MRWGFMKFENGRRLTIFDPSIIPNTLTILQIYRGFSPIFFKQLPNHYPIIRNAMGIVLTINSYSALLLHAIRCSRRL